MSQADEVRAAADIVRVVGDYVKLRKAGTNLMGLCPFHREKTPSFAVHPVKQIFHCFGCGVGGDVFKFMMLIEDLTFPEALRRVAEKAGVALRETIRDEAYDAQARMRALLYKIHEVATKFYAAQLGGTAEGRAARAYLADRGVSDEMVGHFRLGYAPSDGQALFRHLSALGFPLEVLESSGLIIRDADGQRFYDRFRRRVIFPIANDSGRVVAFGGRVLGDDQPKYLNSPETPIYTKGRVLYHLDRAASVIRKLDYAILVEGYMDCIAVVSCGIENVVASCGTSLTENQVRLLARHSRRVAVNYDPDSAGVAATERSLGLLLEEGFEAKVLILPSGLDPDAFVRNQGAGAYRERLTSAPTYVDYLTERAAAQHDLRTPEGKVAAANAVMPFLAKVANPLLRDELASRVADRLRLDQRLLGEQLRRAARDRKPELVVGPETRNGVEHFVKQLIRAFLEDATVADELLPDLVESGDCAGLPGEGVFSKLWELRQQGRPAEVSDLEAFLSPDERRIVYEGLFWPGDPVGLERARQYRKALRVRRLKQKLAELVPAIDAAGRERDWERLARLKEAKLLLDKELDGLSRGAKIADRKKTD